VFRKDPKSQARPQSKARWTFLLGLLCLALVVFGSTVQVAHSHPGGDISHADCSLCATAHVVAQVVSSPVVFQAALAVAPVQDFAPLPRPSTLSVFALFTRPPPAVSTAA
jgi:hypothetical protein